MSNHVVGFNEAYSRITASVNNAAARIVLEKGLTQERPFTSPATEIAAQLLITALAEADALKEDFDPNQLSRALYFIEQDSIAGQRSDEARNYRVTGLEAENVEAMEDE